MSPLELLAAITGILGVWLSARENVWNWPVGLVNVALYAVVFHGVRLYADMGLQVIYFILCAYGWWAWLHGGAGRGALHVSRISPRLALLLLALGVGGAVLLGAVLHYGTDASYPWLDSALASGSLVAQYMLTRKQLENWIVWIVVDAIYVALYLAKGLQLTAALYAVFLALAIAGLRQWRRSMRADAALVA
jgi:nicotinamide mononucleotide transporter